MSSARRWKTTELPADRDLGHGLGGRCKALEYAKAFQKEGSAVVMRDTAGARSISRYHPRIIDQIATWNGSDAWTGQEDHLLPA